MDQALNSQKTPHTSPLRASYGMSFVSILMKNDRVIKGFYCIVITWLDAVIGHMLSPKTHLKLKSLELSHLQSYSVKKNEKTIGMGVMDERDFARFGFTN